MTDQQAIKDDPVLRRLREELRNLNGDLADIVMRRLAVTAQVGHRKAEMGWEIVQNGQEQAMKEQLLVALQERGYTGTPQLAYRLMDVIIADSVEQQRAIVEQYNAARPRQ